MNTSDVIMCLTKLVENKGLKKMLLFNKLYYQTITKNLVYPIDYIHKCPPLFKIFSNKLLGNIEKKENFSNGYYNFLIANKITGYINLYDFINSDANERMALIYVANQRQNLIIMFSRYEIWKDYLKNICLELLKNSKYDYYNNKFYIKVNDKYTELTDTINFDFMKVINKCKVDTSRYV